MYEYNLWERATVETGDCKITRVTTTLRVLLYEVNILYILSAPCTSKSQKLSAV